MDHSGLSPAPDSVTPCTNLTSSRFDHLLTLLVFHCLYTIFHKDWHHQPDNCTFLRLGFEMKMFTTAAYSTHTWQEKFNTTERVMYGSQHPKTKGSANHTLTCTQLPPGAGCNHGYQGKLKEHEQTFVAGMQKARRVSSLAWLCCVPATFSQQGMGREGAAIDSEFAITTDTVPTIKPPPVANLKLRSRTDADLQSSMAVNRSQRRFWVTDRKTHTWMRNALRCDTLFLHLL